MWEPRVSINGLLMNVLWFAAFVLVGLAWIFEKPALGQLGIVCAAIAATLVVVQDNRRTRQLIRRAINRISSRS